MKKNRIVILVILVMAIFFYNITVAVADESISDSITQIDPDVKWIQPPDMECGVNIRSIEDDDLKIVADDWRCKDPRPVKDVHFWGSYIGWTDDIPPQPGIEGFVIRIYEDVPATAQSYSHPGIEIYKEFIPEFEEQHFAKITLPDDSIEQKFYYSLDLPIPFIQVEGTIYWISIAAVMPDVQYPWGWETSVRHWNDNACIYSQPNWLMISPDLGLLPDWYWECHQNETVDMAFALTVGAQTPPIEPIKWQHRPDMVHGINVISIANEDGPIVAEDWLCLDGSPVSDLHFWGSYPGWYPRKIPEDPNNPPDINKFVLRIYSDKPATPNSYSHPGELLYEETVEDFIETYVASIRQDEVYEHKYRYDLDLPRPFRQERGTIYWLSIAAVMPVNYEYPWGWESSIDRWNDFAVQRDTNQDMWEMVKHPHTEYTDMAFELTTHEGPIKWLQFPDMANGENIISFPENPVVADDWLCTDGKPITEVHFWGSYLTMDGPTLTNGYKHWEQDNSGPPDSLLPDPPGVDVFKLSFHEDIPAGDDPQMPWSHPGDLINEVRVDYQDVKERYWDSVPHAGPDGIWWEHKFYYIIVLREPFEQIQGTVYWLDIGAKPKDDSDWVWGWETSKDHWNDNAVKGWIDQNWWWNEINSPLTTINFEDLVLGTQYGVGDIFATAGTAVAVMPFQWGNGIWTSGGHPIVMDTGLAGGSGNEMNVNNTNLDFNFITAPVTRLELLFGEYGGNLNIMINGEFINFGDFNDINGSVIGGVQVTVQDLGNGKGILELDGTIYSINQFAVGGQELFIDDIKLVKQVDMAFLLTTGKGMCGDVDENGIINILDVRLLMNHIVNPGAYPVDPWTGNVDGINGISVNDLTLLLKHVFNPGGYPLNCP